LISAFRRAIRHIPLARAIVATSGFVDLKPGSLCEAKICGDNVSAFQDDDISGYDLSGRNFLNPFFPSDLCLDVAHPLKRFHGANRSQLREKADGRVDHNDHHNGQTFQPLAKHERQGRSCSQKQDDEIFKLIR